MEMPASARIGEDACQVGKRVSTVIVIVIGAFGYRHELAALPSCNNPRAGMGSSKWCFSSWATASARL